MGREEKVSSKEIDFSYTIDYRISMRDFYPMEI